MSMIMSSFLIIILLYFSLHATQPTHVVFLAKKPDARAYHQISISKDVDDEMIKHSKLEAKALLSKELRPEQGGSGRDGDHQDAVDESSRQYQKPDSGANLPSSSTTEESKGLISGEVRSDPVVSVSLKANTNNDHKRNWEHHPGFNLDYLPPRTHPPSHN